MPRSQALAKNGWLTLADVLHDLGDVSPERVRANPPLGAATEADLIHIQTHEKRHYELVHGVLVEKIMGAPQSAITLFLDRRLGRYAEDHDLGFTMGADGPTRLLNGLVRMPDLSFISWKRMPTKEYPATAITDVVPNLAVEVLSEGNTPAEIRRKLKEYFLAGVERVWVIDPYRRIVTVYSAPDRHAIFTEADTLDGEDVLPGFTLAVKDLFARLPKDFARARTRKRRQPE